MRAPPETTTERTRSALTGSVTSRLILLGNFEVENEWAAGEAGLPRMAMTDSQLIVNRMDEFAVTLAGSDDTVLLKGAPDPDYLAYLAGLGLALPTIRAVTVSDPHRTVTQDVLADASLLAVLRDLASGGWGLWPHGVSSVEEQLAVRTGLPLAAAPAGVAKRVNGKTYSRTIANELGLRQPVGYACRTLDQFAAAVEEARTWLRAGRPVIVKDAYGVSGKGLFVARDVAALERLHRMVARNGKRSGRGAVGLVVEELIDKRADLNYQFTVDRGGEVAFDFVREAITERGVHMGHRIPAGTTAGQDAELRAAAAALGARLAADGYFGVVGVDALVGADGLLYPVIEINARNNMSTYQERLREAVIGTDRAALATHYPVRLRRALPFAALYDVLGDLLIAGADGTGLLVNNFATVNAGAFRGEPFEGRLYAMAVADTPEGAAALDRAVRSRLAAVEERSGDE